MRFVAAGPGTGYSLDPDTLLPVADDPAAMRRAAEELLTADGALPATEGEGDAAGPQPTGGGARALRISAAAWMFAAAGDPERADRVFLTTLTSHVGWTARQRAVVSLRRAQVHQVAGRREAAVALAREVVAHLDQEAGPPDPLVATALHHLGKALLDVGALDEASDVLQRALALREAAGDADLTASTRLALALLARRRAR